MRSRKSLGVAPHWTVRRFFLLGAEPELVPEIGLKRRRVTFTSVQDIDPPRLAPTEQGDGLRQMKRERGEDAHEDADTVEPQVKVDDAILSFEKELDQMSESSRVKTGK